MRKAKKTFKTKAMVVIELGKIIPMGILSILEKAQMLEFWFGAFNPLISVLFTFGILSKQIKNILNDPSVAFIHWAIVIMMSFVIIFFENAIVELKYRLRRGDEQYEIIQKAQRYSNNYALTIVSLISLYFAVSPPQSDQENRDVFVLGVIFFLATIYNDFYYEIISSPGLVKELSEKVREKRQEDSTK